MTVEITSLPPFHAKATCPKCGHHDVNVRYHKGSDSYWDHCGVMCKNLASAELRRGEHLLRECQRCYYRWAEACVTTAEVVDAVTSNVSYV